MITPVFHLEGMGVMGCLTALRLLDAGYEFTWHDTEEERVQSWRASTGAIMPFGDDESIENLEAWRSLLREESHFRDVLRKHMTRSRFCYFSKQPPHKGRQQGVAPLYEVGPIKVSNTLALNMDVQNMVRKTRDVLKDSRTEGPAPQQIVIVTHGWHDQTIGSWSWGWSAIVKVSMHDSLALRLQDTHGVGTFYLRDGYQLCYLYPVGRLARHEGLYYAGTTLITQRRKPKDLPVEPKYLTWMDQLARNSGGLLWVERMDADTLRQAWRPMPKPDLDLITVDSGTYPNVHIYIRPQYGNGIRMFPATFDALLNCMDGVYLGD